MQIGFLFFDVFFFLFSQLWKMVFPKIWQIFLWNLLDREPDVVCNFINACQVIFLDCWKQISSFIGKTNVFDKDDI